MLKQIGQVINLKKKFGCLIIKKSGKNRGAGVLNLNSP